MTFQAKPGVYLCRGCGIGDSVDVDAMEQVAADGNNLSLCRRHDVLCSDAGLKQISEDIASESINQAIIAACSPRVMAEKFSFAGTQVVRANIREQVAWARAAGEKTTQMAAEDNLRMAIAQATKIAPPEPWLEGKFSERILVLGGGLEGLTAAREGARAGAQILLVEKSDQLGGMFARFAAFSPDRPPYREAEDNPIPGLIEEVTASKAITVMLNTVVAQTDGQPGQFKLTLETAGTAREETVGAIVVATGARPYDPAKLGHLGYGASADIVTNFELEEKLSVGTVSKSDGGAVKSVAFVQCAGQRDPAHLPYCSSFCCTASIRHALRLIEQDPEIMCYIVFQELRTAGVAEEYYRVAQEKGVVFMRGEVKEVDGKTMTVTYDDAMIGESVPLQGLDMIVLASGMVPNATDPERPTVEINEEQAIHTRPDINPLAPLAVAGYKDGLEAVAPEPVAEQGPLEGAPLLNLQYRQGPHIPMLADGFSDSHYICFPYESRRTGVYPCGTLRRPMDSGEAALDATGAMLKAIQTVRNVAEGASVHPRVGDLSFPKIVYDACTKCRRCTVECPFGAIDENEEDFPLVNPTRCRRCGTCMGACPVRTISFDNYSVEMMTAMIQAVEVPDEFHEVGAVPRVLLLACENDAYPAIDMSGLARQELNAHVRIIPVRCLGSVSLLCISDALSKGYDGVIMMGCKSGDDYQCHFIKGSAIAQERMSKVGETLKSMMLEEERVQTFEISIADSKTVAQKINDFVANIETIGLNPFKGF